MSADLNSGVSRVSGRVRKKTVKLIEMEDLPPMAESTTSGNNCTNNGTKKSPAPAKLKIVIGGKEVVREVVPIKASLYQNDSEKVKTLAPIKFRLNSSSVTHTLEESPGPMIVKKIKVENEKVQTIQSAATPTVVVPPAVLPAKAKPVTVNVNLSKKESMTPKLKATPVTDTPKNSTKSKGVTKSINIKNSTPKVVKKEKRRHITAYTLWSRENRSIIQQDHPELDFAGVSKRMGEVWQHLSNSEKYIWKMRAQKEIAAIVPVPSSSRPVPKPPSSSKAPRKTAPKSGGKNKSKKNATASSSSVSCSALRMAAHLKMIGESLETIGKQLSSQSKEEVSQSQLCLLLDCTLSSLGPLLALTTLDPRLDGCPRDVHHKILDDISYIMPNI